MRLSVIIPLAPGESAWTALVPSFQALASGSELLFVGPQPPAGKPPAGIDLSHLRLAWIESPLGRARQLNAGARSATAPHLWFVHADTRLSPSSIGTLLTALRSHADALHYFDLAFDGGPPMMLLNRFGVWVRTRLFGLPFGDQAFCVSRSSFDRLEGFDETVSYGEDHVFVWQAARVGIGLRPVGSTIATSARKYEDRGWLKTTTKHLHLTLKQALPQWWLTHVKR